MACAGKGDTIRAMDGDEPAYCANCEYDLTGLPAVGNCPECGCEYSLWPDSDRPRPLASRTRKPPWILRHSRSILLVLATLPVLFCSGVLSLTTNNQYVWAVGALLSFLMAVGAVVYYFFEKVE